VNGALQGHRNQSVTAEFRQPTRLGAFSGFDFEIRAAPPNRSSSQPRNAYIRFPMRVGVPFPLT
jgi:hypothetical protein